jgi:hypothetical protein
MKSIKSLLIIAACVMLIGGVGTLAHGQDACPDACGAELSACVGDVVDGSQDCLIGCSGSRGSERVACTNGCKTGAEVAAEACEADFIDCVEGCSVSLPRP